MSILKTIPIMLDLKRVGAQSQALPTLVEGDNGNVFVITMTDDGEPLDLTDRSRIVCVFSKTSDGLTVEQDTSDGSVTVGGTDNNVITIALKSGSFGAGTNNCEVQIYSDADDVLVTSANFNFRGRKGIMNDETIQSEDKYPILALLITQVNEALSMANPFKSVSASAITLDPGDPATANVAVGTDSVAFTFGIPQGEKGDTGNTGPTGNGIASITKTGSAGLVDTYRILYTNGTYTDITITNGDKGDTGNTGPTGNGIASISLVSGTHAPGTSDTYRVTMTNGSVFDFQVYNGADGSGSVISVNGKSGTVVLSASDVGAEPSGSVSTHDSDSSAHSTLFSGKQDTISDLGTIRSGASDGATALTKATDKVLFLTNVACSAVTGDFATVSDSKITADHVVAEITFSAPSYVRSDVTWTTSAGSLVLNGKCFSTITADIVLIKKDN